MGRSLGVRSEYRSVYDTEGSTLVLEPSSSLHPSSQSLLALDVTPKGYIWGCILQQHSPLSLVAGVQRGEPSTSLPQWKRGGHPSPLSHTSVGFCLLATVGTRLFCVGVEIFLLV